MSALSILVKHTERADIGQRASIKKNALLFLFEIPPNEDKTEKKHLKND